MDEVNNCHETALKNAGGLFKKQSIEPHAVEYRDSNGIHLFC
jgi:hypothetical protein